MTERALEQGFTLPPARTSEALVLSEEEFREAARKALRDLARVVDLPWQMATGSDLTFPGVPGRRTRRLRPAGAYLARLHSAAAHDATLATTFLRVSDWWRGPGALTRPGVAVRVLRHALRRPPAR